MMTLCHSGGWYYTQMKWTKYSYLRWCVQRPVELPLSQISLVTVCAGTQHLNNSQSQFRHVSCRRVLFLDDLYLPGVVVSSHIVL